MPIRRCRAKGIVRPLAGRRSRACCGRARCNPRWIRGQMRHGHRGAVREIAETLDNLFAYAALTDAAPSRHFDLSVRTRHAVATSACAPFIRRPVNPARRARLWPQRFAKRRGARGFWISAAQFVGRNSRGNAEVPLHELRLAAALRKGWQVLARCAPMQPATACSCAFACPAWVASILESLDRRSPVARTAFRQRNDRDFFARQPAIARRRQMRVCRLLQGLPQ